MSDIRGNEQVKKATKQAKPKDNKQKRKATRKKVLYGI